MAWQPGLPGSNFPGPDFVIREIKDLKRQIRELAAANQLATAGIKAIENGIVVEGSQTVNGPLMVNGPATITGTLDLPAGIIGNAALESPVQIGTASNGLNNYAIGTTSAARASVTLTVPDGFTQAVVTANPSAMGFNATGSVDYLYVMAIVESSSGGELYTGAANGVGVGLASPFHTTLSGLNGGDEITVSVATRTGFNTWAATGANQATIHATAIFLR